MYTKNVIKKVAQVALRPAIVHVVTGAVAMNVPQVNKAQRVLTFYGKIVIASMIIDHASVHVDTKIDTAAQWLSKYVNESNANK